ncbi:MAG: SoxR reducing system RseC family protein [Oscillospiraceae bacterium]|nr:SoxR reducing system RseC family protein [Oscillospiraceae bacterium]
MQQQVQVSRVYPDGSAEVFVRRESACSGDCHKCSGCGAQKQQVFVRASNPIGAAPGDQVIVSSENAQVLPAMLVVYILPLALMLAGYFAGLALPVPPGLLSCLGFCLGVGLIVLYNRFVEKRRPVRYVITAYAER